MRFLPVGRDGYHDNLSGVLILFVRFFLAFLLQGALRVVSILFVRFRFAPSTRHDEIGKVSILFVRFP